MILSDAARHTYRPRDFRQSLRPDDFWKYDDLKQDCIEPVLTAFAIEFARSHSAARDIRSSQLRERRVFRTACLYDTLAIRRSEKILRRTLAYPVFSRDEAVRQLIQIMKTEKDVLVFRTDISRFFESVPFRSTIRHLEFAGFSNLSTLRHLKSIRKHVKRLGCTGLPRGLSISSTLAEFSMDDFDTSMRSLPSCIYYCRYVDDIIVVCGDVDIDVKQETENRLPEHLSLNTAKTATSRLPSSSSVEYLGYSISLSQRHPVSVAKRKLSKTKKRLVLSLRRYSRDGNFPLFLARVRFLTSSTRMRIAGRRKAITTGFRFQYALCDVKVLESQLTELDTFFQGILRSKRYALARTARMTMKQSQLDQLFQMSFLSGYRHRITTELSRKVIAQIKGAWRYE